MEWTGPHKKSLRKALITLYNQPKKLAMFVSDELDLKLNEISTETNLETQAYELIEEGCAEGAWIDQLYKKLCEMHQDHPAIAQLQNELQGKSLIVQSKSPKLTDEDLSALFLNILVNYDYIYLQPAFLRAFKAVFKNPFWAVRPDRPSLNGLKEIQMLLEEYDKPELAVRFVEQAITEIQRQSSEEELRDLTPLKTWRDRITQQFNVPPPAPAPAPKKFRHAYLLVALEEIGSDVNVYPELRITGAEKPTGFGAKPTTCPVDQVADWISEWIHQAEEVLEASICDDEEVTLEVFLPCQHLEEDIATIWSVKDKRGSEIVLGTYRRLLVRSSDRIRDHQIQKALERRWTKLEACVKAKNACDKFHLQKECPQQKGTLCALLKDDEEAPGLKFVAQLPTDPNKRTDLLNDIIDAAIPIALWSSEEAEPDTEILKTEFDALLRSCHLTNFADLAKQWRKRRLDPVSANLAKPVRLLCDRPDRLPSLPDLKNREDEDAIVAC